MVLGLLDNYNDLDYTKLSGVLCLISVLCAYLYMIVIQIQAYIEVCIKTSIFLVDFV